MNTLQTAMLGNATFSSLSAIGFLVFQRGIASNSNIPEVVLATIALSLIGFAAILVYGVFGTQQKAIGRLTIGLDWAWVVGSAIALFLPMTNIARIGIAIIGALVAGFALWQQHGLNKRGV
jgi:hypothetical protein